MAENNGSIKTEVELLKRDFDLLSGLAEKFDIAIDRLTDVSTAIDKMLAVHEARLENQERQSEVTHQRITEFKKEIMDEIKIVRAEITKQNKDVSERIGRLERWKWFIVGIGAAIGALLAMAVQLKTLI
jgi:hypothetical protein